MRRRGTLLVGALLGLGLSGCPVTDDYYLLPASQPDGHAGDGATGGKGAAGSGASAASTQAGSEQGAQPGGGSETGGTSTAGNTTGGTDTAGTAPVAGSSEGGATEVGGQPAGGEGGAAPCVPTTERCNGHDDNCNELTDEQACPTSCYGFVVSGEPEHGYMYCTSNRKATFTNARKACEMQSMRLAWLDSETENGLVSAKIDALGNDTEVLFGATDQGLGNEGTWIWYAGEQFWDGDENGDPVGNAFNAWAPATPNDGNNNEDCAVLNPGAAAWGDRYCDATYAYLCEQPD